MRVISVEEQQVMALQRFAKGMDNQSEAMQRLSQASNGAAKAVRAFSVSYRRARANIRKWQRARKAGQE